MGLTYNGPPYPYTTTIPEGTRALRAAIEHVYELTRTEVVRDRTRCNAKPSEHCSCRAIDAFTDDRKLRRRIFENLVDHAETLGVQSVIADRRVWGYGQWRERAYSGDPHTDHVHVGLTRVGSEDLFYSMAIAVLHTPAAPAGLRKAVGMWTLEEIGAAVWEHVVRDLVGNVDSRAHNVLEWAHLAAHDAAKLAAAINARLDVIEGLLRETRPNG